MDNRLADKTLLDHCASAILQIDQSGRVLFANLAITHLFGYAPDEVIGQSVTLLIPTDAHANHEKYIKQFLKKPTARSMGLGNSFPAMHKTGKKIYVSITMSLVQAGEPQIILTISESSKLESANKNLVQSKKLSESRLKHNRRLLSISEGSVEVVVILNNNHKIGWVNAAFNEMFDVRSYDAVGQHPLFCIASDQPKALIDAFDEALNQASTYNETIKFSRKNNAPVWLNLHLQPTFDDAELTGFVMHGYDVTKKIELEQELRRSNELLESMTTLTKLGSWELNIQDQSLYWSEQVYRIHELPVGTKIKVEDAVNYYAPEARDIIQKAVNSGIENGKHWDLELPFITAKNNRIWVRTVGFAEYENGRAVKLKGAFQDITEMRTAVENEKQANKVKSAFLSTISHELRTPINGIVGCSDLMLTTELDQDQFKYASLIERSASSLLKVVNDILDYSKLNAGKLSIDNQVFNIRHWLINKSDLFEYLATSKGLDFNLEISEQVECAFFGDPHRMDQVLTNLCGNAIKFTESGSISIVVEASKSGILFSVKDTGIGIEKDKIPLLFSEFEQLDSSQSRRFGGTGLGLAISKQLVTNMDGKIGVESQLGQGSRFWFELPLNADNDLLKALPKTPDIELPSCLIVCKNHEVINDWQKAASNFHFDIRCIEEAQMALEVLAKEEKWKFVLVYNDDFDLPGELLVKSVLRRIQPDTIIFVMGDMGEVDSEQVQVIQRHRFEPELPLADHHNTVPLQLLRYLSYQTQKHFPFNEQNLNELSVLVVEDNEINQQIVTTMLSQLGAKTVTANHGKEALFQLEWHGPFDLILMDCQMPILDGYETTRHIRKHIKSDVAATLIIAATAHAHTSELHEIKACGMNDYIMKPFNREQLLQVIQKNLPSRDADASIRSAEKS